MIMNRIVRTGATTLAICSGLILVLVGVSVLIVAKPTWNKWLYLAHVRLLYGTPCVPDGFTGVWREWHSDGFRLECRYRNGLRDGMERGWDEDGTKRSEAEWKEGRKIGVEKSWYRLPKNDPRQGRLSAEFCYSVKYNEATSGVIFFENGQKEQAFVLDEE